MLTTRELQDEIIRLKKEKGYLYSGTCISES